MNLMESFMLKHSKRAYHADFVLYVAAVSALTVLVFAMGWIASRLEAGGFVLIGFVNGKSDHAPSSSNTASQRIRIHWLVGPCMQMGSELPPASRPVTIGNLLSNAQTQDVDTDKVASVSGQRSLSTDGA